MFELPLAGSGRLLSLHRLSGARELLSVSQGGFLHRLSGALELPLAGSP